VCASNVFLQGKELTDKAMVTIKKALCLLCKVCVCLVVCGAIMLLCSNNQNKELLAVQGVCVAT
jgi:NAD-dependent dihydropyrimidine dehydrogenase PreA subunit